MTATEWEKYSCVLPVKHSFSAGNGEKLRTISHVAHVPAARRIIQDGRIRAGLVYDKSKLNKSRYCVTWLSANSWINGSIYGSVEFRFSWDELIEGKRFYWVEAMPDYKPPAFRIFITERHIKNSKWHCHIDEESAVLEPIHRVSERLKPLIFRHPGGAHSAALSSKTR